MPGNELRSDGGVLVYRIGSLGDTLVSVPALRAIRQHFRDLPVTLLYDHHIGKPYVLASDLIGPTGFVDSFLPYEIDASPSGRLLRPLRMARLLIELRRRKFGAVVYLAPSNRPLRSVARDRRFFRSAGIGTLIGFGGFDPPPKRPPAGYARVPSEVDRLLARIGRDGIPVPEPGRADVRLSWEGVPVEELSGWLKRQPTDGGRRWIGVGPGCKQPVNRWPLDRFDRLVRELILRHDVWPIVFGGPEDASDARLLLASWKRGWLAAGELSLLATIAAMSRCRLHVGNDTGTMHMAAASGTTCVGIYSSRNLPGLWHPYGDRHVVLRTPIDCENCELFACVDRKMACLLAIDVPAALEACERVLGPEARR